MPAAKAVKGDFAGLGGHGKMDCGKPSIVPCRWRGCRLDLPLFSAAGGPLRIGFVLFGVLRRWAGAARFLESVRSIVARRGAFQTCSAAPQAQAPRRVVEFASGWAF